ncbi:hypothetical protein D3C87_2149490 [compost metagenome]
MSRSGDNQTRGVVLLNEDFGVDLRSIEVIHPAIEQVIVNVPHVVERRRQILRLIQLREEGVATP